jgi:hypothetical protein
MSAEMLQGIGFWESFGSIFPASVVIINKAGEIVYANNVFKNLVVLNHANLFQAIDNNCLINLNKIILLCEKEKKVLSNTLKIKASGEKILYFT